LCQKGERISKENSAGWWFILILVSFVIGSGYTLYLTISTRRRQLREEQRIRNKAEKLQLEHQALYAMMNPHFTFNALQSIQNFIQRNDKKSAHKFLASFAKLVRKNLDSTQVDFISLCEELDRLKLYLALEKMRFPETFDYGFDLDPALDRSSTPIPPMLLPPFVDN
ncbi:MAG: histidine kinase, partial [Bacteroidota bacterium]